MGREKSFLTTSDRSQWRQDISSRAVFWPGTKCCGRMPVFLSVDRVGCGALCRLHDLQPLDEETIFFGYQASQT